MQNSKQLLPILKQLLKVLKKENKALKNNDGVQIEKILKQKEPLTEQLSLVDRELTEAEIKIALEIKQLQDNNLLLTRQAVAFTDNFLKIVGQSAQKNNATYSKKGSLTPQEDLSFINQSM